jgi:hypothetical protein
VGSMAVRLQIVHRTTPQPTFCTVSLRPGRA